MTGAALPDLKTDENQEVQHVAKFLGGAKTLKATPLDAFAAHDMLSQGIPGKALSFLLNSLRVISADDVLEKGVGLSVRTLQRLNKDPESRLDEWVGGRTWQFARILARAADVLGTQDEAERWLEQPAVALQGRAPLSLLSTPEGVHMVETLLRQMDYGVYV